MFLTCTFVCMYAHVICVVLFYVLGFTAVKILPFGDKELDRSITLR